MRHRIYFIGLLFLLSGTSFSQPLDSALQQFVKSTLIKNTSSNTAGTDDYLFRITDGAIYYLRQDYLLKSKATGKLYGIQNKEYFGREKGSAIAAGEKLYTFGKMAKPWENDENFSNLDASDLDSLQPYPDPPLLLNIVGDTLKTADTLYEATKNGLNTLGAVPAAQSIAISGAFPVSNDASRRGRLLVYHVARDMEAAPEIKATAIPVDTAWSHDDGAEIRFDWKEDRTILGGVYYAESYSVGKVEVAAVALFEPTEDGRGHLRRLVPVKPKLESRGTVEPADKTKKSKENNKNKNRQ